MKIKPSLSASIKASIIDIVKQASSDGVDECLEQSFKAWCEESKIDIYGKVIAITGGNTGYEVKRISIRKAIAAYVKLHENSWDGDSVVAFSSTAGELERAARKLRRMIKLKTKWAKI